MAHRKYEISKNKKLELKYFCRQYREKQAQLFALTELKSPNFDQVGGKSNAITSSVEDMAVKRMQLEQDTDLIENSLRMACGGLYKYFFSNVVDGVPYEYLGVPMSRRSFYRMRDRFFILLTQKIEISKSWHKSE